MSCVMATVNGIDILGYDSEFGGFYTELKKPTRTYEEEITIEWELEDK